MFGTKSANFVKMGGSVFIHPEGIFETIFWKIGKK
jgi:hypothetical protein